MHADLHTHTARSDGRLSPAQLVEKAADRGIQVLAVTDHDTLDGLDEAAEAAKAHRIRFLPGVELSVSAAESALHLLAYAFDSSHPGLRAHLRDMQEARRTRAWSMVERLRQEGVEVEDAQLRAEIASTAAVGRPHVAAALVRAGHVASAQEAFDRYLGREQPGFVSKPEFSAERALEMIHEAGGVGVLAHPGHWTSTAQIRDLSAAGLDGIEVRHPAHGASLRGYYNRVARSYGLLSTGGSDYHGRTDTDEDAFGTIGLDEPEWERFWAAVA